MPFGGQGEGRTQTNFLGRRWDPIWGEDSVIHLNLRGGYTGEYTCKKVSNYLLKILHDLSYTSILKNPSPFDDIVEVTLCPLMSLTITIPYSLHSDSYLVSCFPWLTSSRYRFPFWRECWLEALYPSVIFAHHPSLSFISIRQSPQTLTSLSPGKAGTTFLTLNQERPHQVTGPKGALSHLTSLPLHTAPEGTASSSAL